MLRFVEVSGIHQKFYGKISSFLNLSFDMSLIRALNESDMIATARILDLFPVS